MSLLVGFFFRQLLVYTFFLYDSVETKVVILTVSVI